MAGGPFNKVARCNSAVDRSRRAGFTLIEVLVVVSIIALLISILLPAISSIRTQARRTTCAAQLKQIGIALVSYLQDSHDRMPHASLMPSIGPGPLMTTAEPIYIADVLARQVNNQTDVFKCPEDKPRFTNRPLPNTGKSFFESEKSSYAYRAWLGGLTPEEFNNHPSLEGYAVHTIWVMRDYDNFHGTAGKNGARRYLYIDGHVTDYEN